MNRTTTAAKGHKREKYRKMKERQKPVEKKKHENEGIMKSNKKGVLTRLNTF